MCIRDRGATVDLGLLWSIADTFNGLMSIPNLIALLLLSGTVAKPFFVVYSFVSILGATVDLGLLWSIADTFNLSLIHI